MLSLPNVALSLYLIDVTSKSLRLYGFWLKLCLASLLSLDSVYHLTQKRKPVFCPLIFTHSLISLISTRIHQFRVLETLLLCPGSRWQHMRCYVNSVVKVSQNFYMYDGNHTAYLNNRMICSYIIYCPIIYIFYDS